MDLQLIFLPESLDDNSIKGYHIGVQNTSSHDYIYTIKIDFKNKTLIEKRGKIESKNICQLDFMPFEELNNTPEFKCDFWKLNKDKTGKKISSFCKIKPKQFFVKKIFLESIQREVILYKLEVSKTILSEKGEDLTTYTKENITTQKVKPNFVYSTDKIDLLSRAEFVNEIDLHLENLTQKGAKLRNNEKLDLQLTAAENFIQKAIKLDASKVYLIHGIGKGKLKERIHDLLHRHPSVRSFKNEYHHKYGYGATEVIFRK